MKSVNSQSLIRVGGNTYGKRINDYTEMYPTTLFVKLESSLKRKKRRLCRRPMEIPEGE